MEDRERKREEEKAKQKKKEFPEEKEGKECPKCRTINNLEARFCEECGYEFKTEVRGMPSTNLVRGESLEVGKEVKEETIDKEEKKEEKEEIKEEAPKKKRSFFTDAQLESIRKSNEEIKEKQIDKSTPKESLRLPTGQASAEESITEVKEVEIGGIKLICIPAGEFMMGSPEAEGFSCEHPQHKVYLDAYCIGKYQVTNKEYSEFLNNYGKDTDDNGNKMIYDSNEMYPGRYNWGLNKESGIWKPVPGYEDYPVIYVTWYGANQYCKWLSKKTGKNFRLPTEAEWERAARGGESYKYSGSNDLNSVGWYWANADKKTHPIGEKKSNGYGIFDMSGNVREWCRDWYDGNYYKNSPKSNPKGPSSGSSRVFRGGSWFGDADFCRCAFRYSNAPSFSFDNLGFRLGRALK